MPSDTTIGLTAKLRFMGDQAIAGMKQVSGAFSGMKTHLQTTKTGFGQVKQGFAGLKIGGLVAGLGIGVAAKKFAEFDGVMADMRATLGAEYSEDFPKLERTARSMGLKTGRSIYTIADAMRSLAKEGMRPNEIMQALTPTLQAMTASGIDAATAAKLVDTTLEKWDLTAKDAGSAVDTMVYAARKSGATLPEFAAGLQASSGTASLLNIDIKDTAAALGLFVQGGLDAQTASMNLNMALLKMSRAAKSGFINVQGLGKIEVKTKNGALDLQTTLANVGYALSSVTDPAKRVNLAMSLFGMKGRESAAALEKLIKDPTALGRAFNDMRTKSDGAAAAMAKLKTDTAEGRFKKLKNTLSNMSIEVGGVIFPMIESGMKAIINTVQVYGPTVVEGLKAGFAGVRDAAGWVVSGVQSISKLFGGGGPGHAGVKSTVEWGVKIMAVAGAYKLLAPVIKNVMNVGIGGAKILKGALGALGSASTGLLGLVAKRFPALTRILPKAGGALGKAINAAEKITAQPVRIVNWDESGGLGGLGAAPGQLSLPGMGGPAGKGVAGKLGGLAGAAGSLLAAGAVGYAAGTWLDQKLGLSDKLSNAMFKGGVGSKTVTSARQQAYGTIGDVTGMAGTAEALVKLAEKGIGSVGTAEGGRAALTTEYMRSRLLAYAAQTQKGNLAHATPEQLKAMVEQIMASFGPRLAEALKNVKVDATLNIDGRPAAKGIATASQENKARRGQTEKPGARRRAAS